MIAHLYGPIEGSEHDSAMLAVASLIDELNQFPYDQNDNALCVYSDRTYSLRRHLQASLVKKT